MTTESISKLHCKRCQYSWFPRNQTPPKVCPKCKSHFWCLDNKALTDQEVDLFIERLTPFAGHKLTSRQVAERTMLGWSPFKTVAGLKQLIREKPGTVVYMFDEKNNRGQYFILGQMNPA